MTNLNIYVGTYQKYNEGSLYGKWIDLLDYSDLEEFYKDIRELHKDEDDPEFMFQDWEVPQKNPCQATRIFCFIQLHTDSLIPNSFYFINRESLHRKFTITQILNCKIGIITFWKNL